jgi:hypothetical protein
LDYSFFVIFCGVPPCLVLKLCIFLMKM